MQHKAINPVEVDLGSLDLRYAHTRVAKPKLLDMLTTSIERFGQITPVFTIPQKGRLVLIDGYVRAGAIKRLGRDTIMADIIEIPEQGALFHLLGETGQRQWEAVEQAWIIRDLKERCGTQENRPSSPPTSITLNGTTSSTASPWWMPSSIASSTTVLPSEYPGHRSEPPPRPNRRKPVTTLPRNKHPNQNQLQSNCAFNRSIHKSTKGSIL